MIACFAAALAGIIVGCLLLRNQAGGNRQARVGLRVGLWGFAAALAAAPAVGHIPGARTFVECAAIMGAYGLHRTITLWSDTGRCRTRRLRRINHATVTGLAAVLTLRLLGPWPPTPSSRLLAAMVCAALTGAAMWRVWSLTRRWTTIVRTWAMRWGLRLISLGGAVILTIVTADVLLLADDAAGNWLPGDDITLLRSPAACGVAAIAAGAALPAIGPGIARPIVWARTWAAYMALGRLWGALVEAFPHIAWEKPTTHDWAIMGQMDIRLTRRVVEIRDGLYCLRPWLNTDVRRVAIDAARSLPQRRRFPVVYAAWIDTALFDHGRLRPRVTPPQAWGTVPGTASWTDEVRQLAAISRALRSRSADRLRQRIDQPTRDWSSTASQLIRR